MRYLRMLSNAIVAAVLASSYVLVLFLQLNPRLSLNAADLLPLAATVGGFYAVHLTALFYAFLVIRQLVVRGRFSPAWISVGVLGWSVGAASMLGAALMLVNLRTFALVLQPDTVRATSLGAVALLATAGAALGILVGRRRTSRRWRALWAVCLVGVATASLAVPVWLRGQARPPLESRSLAFDLATPASGRNARVTIVAIDAGSLALVAGATAEGRLPNFGRILDAGAVVDLATLHPTSAEAVWTAVATGKLPQKNGVRSASIYRVPRSDEPVRLLPDYCFASRLVRFGLLREELHTSLSVRVRTLWGILSAHNISVGVINWPLTYPAPAVNGYIISDRFSALAATTAAFEDLQMVYPTALRSEALGAARASGAATVGAGAEARLAGRHRRPGRIDRTHDRLVQTLDAAKPAQVTIIRYEGTDQIGHYFLRYALPSTFGDVSDEERRQYGGVLEAHYGIIDEMLGRVIEALGPEDLLLVVSGYGIEPLSLGKRVVEWFIGDPEISGSHEEAPDGFLMAYGAAVVRARLLRRASVLDVVPTVLYYLGLPVARDMDGEARTEIFRESLTDQLPITFIPTYER